MRGLILVLSALVWTLAAMGGAVAIVDMKAANYSESWVDFDDADGPVRLERTYNSRSLFEGIFGFGWCSDFETTLDVLGTAELKVTDCGAGLETAYYLNDYDIGAERDAVSTDLMARVRVRRPDLDDEYLDGLAAEMAGNDVMRQEFQRLAGTSLSPAVGTYQSWDGNSTVTFDGHRYVRHQLRGATETFDLAGRMIASRAPDGDALTIRYEHGRLVGIDPEGVPGGGLRLIYGIDGELARVASSTSRAVGYTLVDGDLSSVQLPEGIQRYEYDSLRNMTARTDGQGIARRLTYDTERDWVTSFERIDGCIEYYQYVLSEDDPQNHFFSEQRTECNGTITGTRRFEWVHKFDEGSQYLATAAVTDEDRLTRLDYDPAGLNTRTQVGDDIGIKSYDPSGQLIDVRHADKVETRDYDPRCRVPLKRRLLATDGEGGSEQLVVYRTDSNTCRVVLAASSDGRRLAITYDETPGLASVDFGDGRTARVRYGEALRDPATFGMEGIGEVALIYEDGDSTTLDPNRPAPAGVADALLPALNDFRELLPDMDFDMRCYCLISKFGIKAGE